MRALNIAATGMLAQQLNVEVISNNLSNSGTTAYKRQRPEFQDLLYQNEQRVGSTSNEAGTIVPTGIQLGLGVKTGGVYRILEQGNLQETKNDLDVTIQGRGYFQVQLPNGETGYTRAGSFQLNQDGEFVTLDGNLITGPSAVPAGTKTVSISSSGKVEAFVDGKTLPDDLGNFELVNFLNENGLEALGSNVFKETPASGTPLGGQPGDDGFGQLLQGYLETSNVDSVREITNLIVAQRTYEMNSKVISTADEMLQTTSQLK